ncbi:MAG: DUF6714 family protein [Verrucomicrobiota bacterium]
MTLSEQIKHAFADVPYPGDDQITFSQCEESQQVLHYLQGRTWNELSVQELRFANALGWLSEAGFHYYLPAHLRAVIENSATADTLLDGLKSAFIPPRRKRGNPHAEFTRRITGLTTRQQETIILVYQELCRLEIYDEVDVEMLRVTFAQYSQTPGGL